MMIGPEPMSEDRGDVLTLGHQITSIQSHELQEVVEQVSCVVWPRSGFGVILDAERRHIETSKPFERAVVEVLVGGDHRSELGLDLVVAGDHGRADPSRSGGDSSVKDQRSTANPWFCAVISTPPSPRRRDGVVAAVMAERELVGGGAEREPQHLVAEADAEHRHLCRARLAGLRCWPCERLGIAGPVRHEDAIRRPSEDLVGGGRRAPPSRRVRDRQGVGRYRASSRDRSRPPSPGAALRLRPRTACLS